MTAMAGLWSIKSEDKGAKEFRFQFSSTLDALSLFLIGSECCQVILPEYRHRKQDQLRPAWFCSPAPSSVPSPHKGSAATQ